MPTQKIKNKDKKFYRRGSRAKRVSDLIPEDLVKKRSLFLDRWDQIVHNAWYIVDLRDIQKPEYLPRKFETKKGAMGALLMYLNNTADFRIEKGTVLLKYRLRPMSLILFKNRIFKRIFYKKGGYLKYDYPIERLTLQQRKDFRTMKRRKMRQWNEKLEIT